MLSQRIRERLLHIFRKCFQRFFQNIIWESLLETLRGYFQKFLSHLLKEMFRSFFQQFIQILILRVPPSISPWILQKMTQKCFWKLYRKFLNYLQKSLRWLAGKFLKNFFQTFIKEILHLFFQVLLACILIYLASSALLSFWILLACFFYSYATLMETISDVVLKID